MRVIAHCTLDQLRDLAQAHRLWLRYQAVLLASQGDTAEVIARAFGTAVRSVFSWLAPYNALGAHGGPLPKFGPPIMRVLDLDWAE